MGCLFGKLFGRSAAHSSGGGGGGDASTSELPQTFSWDRRERIDPKDYTISGLNGEEAGRLPGTINGQQFIINNCQDCCIYLFDYIDTITIDDCKNCKFFIGPVSSSVFIRDCDACTLIVGCQQFRTRDCHKLEVLLCCTTQPIVESTSGVKFGCYCYSYPQLEGQFRSSGLCVLNNRWSSIHDFTPTQESRNYSYLPQDVAVENLVPLPKTETFASMQISTRAPDSAVPVTFGNRPKPVGESCLVVIFNSLRMEDHARALVDHLRDNEPGVVVVQTKQVELQPTDALRIFGTDLHSESACKGPVIGIELAGGSCLRAAASFTRESRGLNPEQAFLSSDAHSASKHIDNFYNYADLQMAV